MDHNTNILQKGDIVWINGTRFRVPYSFDPAKDNNLLLKKEDPIQTFVAYSGLGPDGCKRAEEIKSKENLI